MYNDARYLWAKEVASAQFGPLSSGAADIPRTDGAFSLITQIVGHALQGDTEYVANSGNHAAETRIYIEDQPNLDGFGGFFGANGDFGTTHSITLMVDSLALQELFQTVSPTLERRQIEAFFAAASNDLATGSTVGLSGSAEAKPLENALDALRRLFLPGPITETPASPATGGFGNLDNRNKFYEGIAAVKAATSGQTYEINELAGQFFGDVVTEAMTSTTTGLAYRYALKELNPFVVLGADYSVHNVPGANGGPLDLYNEETGTGTVTEEYLRDRYAFLGAKLSRNLANTDTLGLQGISYHDRASSTVIAPSVLTTQRFVFGSDSSETDLIGGGGQDRMYGGEGDDTLTGLDLADYLEGNGGNDTLDGGSGNDILLGQQGNDELYGEADNDRLNGGLGDDKLDGGTGLDTYFYRTDQGQDRIIDSDKTGVIVFDNQTLVGGIRRQGDPADTYTSLDGQFTYIKSGVDLVINNTLTIAHFDFQTGALRIKLADAGELVSGTAPTIDYANGQPTVRYVGDATDNQPIFTAVANHVVYGYGGNDVLNVEGGSAAFTILKKAA